MQSIGPARFLFSGNAMLKLLTVKIVLIAALIAVAAALFPGFYSGNAARTPDEVLAQTLSHSWRYYKTHMMEDGERVVSNHYGGTITEGQSYALLKSLWMDDRQTFERVWRWTKANMRRPDDHLFGWRWGRKSEGGMGLVDLENAVDADQDIAYALLLAGEKWQRPDYAEDARAIIGDLWRINAVQVKGKYYLDPGTWEAFRQDYLTLNPSYFAPYVYRKFAGADPANAEGWLALAQNIYPVLEACSALTANRLPPNWCSVDWETGAIGFSDKQGDGARDFGYDAFRVFWRMAMDARIDDSGGTGLARQYLERHPALLSYWRQHQTLPEGFGPDGSPLDGEPSGFSLSALLARQHVVEPDRGMWYYEQLLAPHYHPEGYWFNSYNDFLHSVIWLHLYTLTL